MLLEGRITDARRGVISKGDQQGEIYALIEVLDSTSRKIVSIFVRNEHVNIPKDVSQWIDEPCSAFVGLKAPRNGESQLEIVRGSQVEIGAGAQLVAVGD